MQNWLHEHTWMWKCTQSCRCQRFSKHSSPCPVFMELENHHFSVSLSCELASFFGREILFPLSSVHASRKAEIWFVGSKMKILMSFFVLFIFLFCWILVCLSKNWKTLPSVNCPYRRECVLSSWGMITFATCPSTIRRSVTSRSVLVDELYGTLWNTWGIRVFIAEELCKL